MVSLSEAPFRAISLATRKPSDLSVARDDRGLRGEEQDELLLARIAKGDRDALAVLFHRYIRVVYGIGRRILRDKAEAEDLAQDVFLHIARKCYLFDGAKGRARSWIIQVTYFQALSRKGFLTERHYYTALDCDDSPAEELATPGIAEYDRSGEALFGRRRWQSIREMLTEDQWETIRLHFFEGYTFAEIGERRNQPVGNVRNHFYRGLVRLRQNMFGVRP